MATDGQLIRKVLNSQVAVTILESVSSCAGLLFCAILVGQKVGSDSLLAFQLILPLGMIIISMSGMIYNGGSISCSQHLGRGDMDMVNQNYTSVTLLGLLLGLIILVPALLFAKEIAMGMGAVGNIANLAADIIRCFGIMTPAFVIFQINLYYFKMDNDQRICVMAALTYFLSMMTFGLYFATRTKMGLLGIGIALDISTYMAMIVTLFHFLNPNRFLKFVKPRVFKRECYETMMAGLPTTLNRIAYSVRVFFMNWMLSAFCGYAAIKAFSVQNNVGELILCVSLGYGFITATMCGMFYGEKDKDSIAMTLKYALISGAILSAILSVVLFFGAEYIAEIFLTDVRTAEATLAVQYFSVTGITSTIFFIFVFFYQSTGRMMLSNILSIVRGVPFMVVAALVMYYCFGNRGIWASFLVADLMGILFIVGYVAYKQKKFPRCMHDYILVPDEYFAAVIAYDDTMKFDAKAVGDAVISVGVALKQHGVEDSLCEKTVDYLGKLMDNVVHHSNNVDSECIIDMRAYIADDKVHIRVRNDAAAYDPISYLTGDRKWIDEMKAIPESISYRYAVNLNNITITM